MGFFEDTDSTAVAEPPKKETGSFFDSHDAVDPQAHIKSLVENSSFDPKSYALENPDDIQTAKEVAWQRKQKPLTLDDVGSAAAQIPGAAVGAVKDFGGGVGVTAANVYTSKFDESEANRERAKTEMAAGLQLGEKRSEGFLDKLFGENSWFGKHMGGPGANMGVASAMQTGNPQAIEAALTGQKQQQELEADRQANPRKYFDSAFDSELNTLRQERDLQQGKVSDQGAVASLLSMGGQKPSETYQSPEELAAQGAPVDPQAIEQMGAVTDPSNLAPLHIPGAGKVAGALLKTPAYIARKIIPEAAEKAITKKVLHGVTLGGGAGLVMNPSLALSHAVPAAKIGAGIAGAKIIGQLMDNAGSKLLNPEFVSATEKKAGQAIIDGNKGALSGIGNAADAQRFASRAIGGAAQGAVGSLPLAALTSDTPQEAGGMIGAGLGFGALSGMTNYNPVRGFRPEVVQSVNEVLAENGARKFYRNGYDNQTHEWLSKADPKVAKQVNAYRGFFDGFKIDGKEPQINVLSGNDYVNAVTQRAPGANAEGAANSRGFAKDNEIFINGDYGNLAGDTLGHEAGGHVAQTIMELVAPKVAQDLTKAASDGLIGENGVPTKGLQDFVNSYNHAFDPTGKTREISSQPTAIKEWLAEQARAVLEGQGPAKFAAGESVRQKIADNLGDYFHKTLGTKRAFSRQEVPAIARQYRDFLYQLGDLRGAEGVTPSESTPQAEIAPAAPKPTETTVAPPETASPEQINANARLQSLGIDQAQVDSARDKHIEDAVALAKTKRGKRAISDKSLQEVASQAGQEFDGLFENYATALENAGTPHAEGKDLTEYILLNELGNGPESRRNVPYKPLENIGAESPQRVVSEPTEGEAYPYQATAEESSVLQKQGWTPEEIAAMPESQVRSELDTKSLESETAGPLSNLPLKTNEPTPANTPALATLSTPDVSVSRIPAPKPETAATSPTPERVSESEIATVLARAEADGKQAAMKKRTEATKAAAVREARQKALVELLPEGQEGLSRHIDPETKEVSVRGNLDPENPVHAALLKEHGYTPDQIKTILDAQDNQGKGIFLRDYNSAAQEGFETGENLDFSGAKRTSEYQASQTSDQKGQRKGAVSKQDKGFTPFSTVVTKSGVNLRGFDHDKFLDNLRKVLDTAHQHQIATGFESVKGQERDQAISDAFRKVAENHKNGWKGDGSKPLRSTATEPITVNPDYIGQLVDSRQALTINAAMHNQSAKPPPEPKAKTELALAKFGKKQQTSKAALALADINSGYVNPETGETNPLREQLVKAGLDVDKQLKPTISNIRPDLIEGGISDTPTHGKSVHAHGFDITPQDLTVSGTPEKRATAAGFLPSTTRDLGFRSQLEKTIEDKIPARASAEQILATLKGAGVKPEEMEYNGLPEYLKTHSGPVSKKDLQEFVKAGGVQLQEVRKGAGKAVAEAGWTDAQFERAIAAAERRRDFDESDRLTAIQEDLRLGNDANETGNETKFSQYQLPGGTNYKELLLTLPESLPSGYTVKERQNQWGKVWDVLKNGEVVKNGIVGEENAKKAAIEMGGSQKFQSSHWDEPNVLAHIRQADHTDVDGNKVRLIEEIQSDWHQKGRKEGYQGENVFSVMKDGKAQAESRTKEEAERLASELGGTVEPSQAKSGVPDAPFKKTWAELAFKRALRSAVEDGQDVIAWPMGETQAERYDLSKQIGKILYDEDTKTLTAWNPEKTKTVIQQSGVTPEKLPDYIGKEMAQKLIDTPPDEEGSRELSGLDLKVGGEGMKGSYDKILPDFVKKYVKKWGGKVDTTQLGQAVERRGRNLYQGDEPLAGPFDSEAEAESAIPGRFARNSTTVHSVAITPEMRDAIMEGQSLFMPGEKGALQKLREEQQATPEFSQWFGKSQVVDENGKPLVVYHGTPDGRFLKNNAVFQSSKERMTGSKDPDSAFWFSGDMKVAESYADDRRAFDYQNAEPRVVDTYLRLENPLVIEANGQNWRDAQKRGKTRDAIAEAKENGNDGVIIRNVKDFYNNNDKSKPGDVYAVFDGSQIKSASGNTGAFSTNDNDIRFLPDSKSLESPVKRHRIERNGQKVTVHREKETGKFAPRPTKQNLTLANFTAPARKKETQELPLANIR